MRHGLHTDRTYNACPLRVDCDRHGSAVEARLERIEKEQCNTRMREVGSGWAGLGREVG